MFDYNKRKNKIQQISSDIIKNQFDDTLKYSIRNHFLINVINEMVYQQADKIKSFASYIFNHSIENKVKSYDDSHHIQCEILKISQKMNVMYIYDESMYGPNLNHIIVIDDKADGRFHIRKLSSKNELSNYKKRNYKVPANNSASEGFIFTYEYCPDLVRMFLKAEDCSKISQEDIEPYKAICKIEEMGDKTFKAYDCLEYAVSMMGSVRRYIDEQFQSDKDDGEL